MPTRSTLARENRGTATVAGASLVALPIAFNAAFATLASTFDYPDVLRKPTSEVLSRFRDGGTRLVLLWWAFAMTAVLLAPVAVLTSAFGWHASDRTSQRLCSSRAHPLAFWFPIGAR